MCYYNQKYNHIIAHTNFYSGYFYRGSIVYSNKQFIYNEIFIFNNENKIIYIASSGVQYG